METTPSLLDNENEEQYLFRIGQLKDQGLIDLSWAEIADKMNTLFRTDESEYRTDTSYRKPYNYVKKFFEAGVFNNSSEDFSEQIKELEKERIKVRDERNEYRRLLREQARRESYKEMFIKTIAEYVSPVDNEPFVLKTDKASYSNSMLISYTDIHTGIDIDNYFNIFDEKVLKQRLNDYLDKIYEVGERHQVSEVSVVMSELVSGLIHPSIRINNNLNLIEQFLTIMDYSTYFLAELSRLFERVHVYVCEGNHSRLSARKEESLKGENMDLLAIPYLKAKMQNFSNIYFATNIYEESVAVFYMQDKLVYAVHGDKDSPNNVVQKLTMLLGKKPDIVFMGHRHTNAMFTECDTKIIQAGSMSGTDDFALDLRLKNKPEQVLAIVNKNGLECLYDVKFN